MSSQSVHEEAKSLPFVKGSLPPARTEWKSGEAVPEAVTEMSRSLSSVGLRKAFTKMFREILGVLGLPFVSHFQCVIIACSAFTRGENDEVFFAFQGERLLLFFFSLSV